MHFHKATRQPGTQTTCLCKLAASLSWSQLFTPAEDIITARNEREKRKRKEPDAESQKEQEK